MRPDPFDIIEKRRLKEIAGRRLHKGQPLKPVNLKIVSLLTGGLFIISICFLTPFNVTDFVNYIDRPITKIRMENQWEYIDSQEVRNLVSLKIGTGFFRFDVKGLKSDLEELPWVDKASISRLWPNTLSLNLREQVAIAYWNDERLLNSRGEIFSPIYWGTLSKRPRRNAETYHGTI